MLRYSGVDVVLMWWCFLSSIKILEVLRSGQKNPIIHLLSLSLREEGGK